MHAVNLTAPIQLASLTTAIAEYETTKHDSEQGAQEALEKLQREESGLADAQKDAKTEEWRLDRLSRNIEELDRKLRELKSDYDALQQVHRLCTQTDVQIPSLETLFRSHSAL